MKGQYPVTFDVEYPERLSRGLIFIKWLLVIPHIFILGIYGALVWFTTFLSWWAILFSGTYPRALFNFAVNFYRWQARVSTYVYLLTDEYPPFGGS